MSVKMLMVKSETVIDCLQLLHTEPLRLGKIDVILEKLHFRFVSEWAYSKLEQVKTDGYSWKN